MQNVLNAIIPTAQAKLPAYGKDIYTDQTSALPETTTDPRSFRFDDIFTSQEPTDTIAVKQAIADDSSIGRIMADVIAREADRTAAQNVDTFVDMPQETQATRWDMTKATAEATARNVAGKLGIDLGPMDTNMSEEGLEKVLEAAWENKQSYPNNEVALTTLQAGALGLNEQDESAYDTMIGALPASAITLSPAGLSFYDPKGFQIGSKAAGTDENITHTKEIAKKWGYSIPEEVIDTVGVAAGVHPVAGFVPSTGGGGTDDLYYQGYTAPDVAKPTPAGPSAADIQRDKQAAIDERNAAKARQDAVNAQMAIEMAARQRQQQQAVAAEQARQAQAAAQAQAASAAQAQIAQNAARAVLASAAGRDRGGPSQRDINAAIEVLGQVDTFASGGQEQGGFDPQGGTTGSSGMGMWT